MNDNERLKHVDNQVQKLAELHQAVTFLQANWFAMDYASRDKAWWRIHRASREVWNLLHPPKTFPSGRSKVEGGTIGI